MAKGIIVPQKKTSCGRIAWQESGHAALLFEAA